MANEGDGGASAVSGFDVDVDVEFSAEQQADLRAAMARSASAPVVSAKGERGGRGGSPRDKKFVEGIAFMDPRDMSVEDRAVSVVAGRAAYIVHECDFVFHKPSLGDGMNGTPFVLECALRVLGVDLARVPSGDIYYNMRRLASRDVVDVLGVPLPDWAPPSPEDWVRWSKGAEANLRAEVKQIFSVPRRKGKRVVSGAWKPSRNDLLDAFMSLPESSFCGSIDPVILMFDRVFPEWRDVVSGGWSRADFAGKYSGAAKFLRPDVGVPSESGVEFAPFNWMSQALDLDLDVAGLNTELDVEFNDWLSRFSLRALGVMHINRWLDERAGKDAAATAAERWRADLVVVLCGPSNIGKSQLWSNVLPALPCGVSQRVEVKGANVLTTKDYCEQVGSAAIAEFAEYAKWHWRAKGAVDEIVSAAYLSFTRKYALGSMRYENLAVQVGTSNVAEMHGLDTTSRRRFQTLMVRENVGCVMPRFEAGGASVNAWVKAHRDDILRAELMWVCEQICAHEAEGLDSRFALTVPLRFKQLMKDRHAMSQDLSPSAQVFSDLVTEVLVAGEIWQVSSQRLSELMKDRVPEPSGGRDRYAPVAWAPNKISSLGGSILDTLGYEKGQSAGTRKVVWRNPAFEAGAKILDGDVGSDSTTGDVSAVVSGAPTPAPDPDEVF